MSHIVPDTPPSSGSTIHIPTPLEAKISALTDFMMELKQSLEASQHQNASDMAEIRARIDKLETKPSSSFTNQDKSTPFTPSKLTLETHTHPLRPAPLSSTFTPLHPRISVPLQTAPPLHQTPSSPKPKPITELTPLFTAPPLCPAPSTNPTPKPALNTHTIHPIPARPLTEQTSSKILHYMLNKTPSLPTSSSTALNPSPTPLQSLPLKPPDPNSYINTAISSSHLQSHINSSNKSPPPNTKSSTDDSQKHISTTTAFSPPLHLSQDNIPNSTNITFTLRNTPTFLEFPSFVSTAVLEWLFQDEPYFSSLCTPSEEKVAVASHYLVMQVANATYDMASNGITCATILTCAIFVEGYKCVAAGVDVMHLRHGISMQDYCVVTNLKSKALLISMSQAIAQIGPKSAKGQRETGGIITSTCNAAKNEETLNAAKQEVSELREDITDKQEHENTMLQALGIRVEQEQRVNEDACKNAEQDQNTIAYSRTKKIATSTNDTPSDGTTCANILITPTFSNEEPSMVFEMNSEVCNGIQLVINSVMPRQINKSNEINQEIADDVIWEQSYPFSKATHDGVSRWSIFEELHTIHTPAIPQQIDTMDTQLDQMVIPFWSREVGEGDLSQSWVTDERKQVRVLEKGRAATQGKVSWTPTANLPLSWDRAAHIQSAYPRYPSWSRVSSEGVLLRAQVTRMEEMKKTQCRLGEEEEESRTEQRNANMTVGIAWWASGRLSHKSGLLGRACYRIVLLSSSLGEQVGCTAVACNPAPTRSIDIPMKNPRSTKHPTINQLSQSQISNLLLFLFLLFHFLFLDLIPSHPSPPQQPFKVIPINILRRIPVLLIKQHDMSMPFPNPIIRPGFFMKPHTDVVLTDRDSLTRIRLQRIHFSRKDDTDDLFLELGFFLGKPGPRVGGVFVVRFIGEVVGGVEEQVLQGLREKRVVSGIIGWVDLKPTHHGLEQQLVEVGCVAE